MLDYRHSYVYEICINLLIIPVANCSYPIKSIMSGTHLFIRFDMKEECSSTVLKIGIDIAISIPDDIYFKAMGYLSYPQCKYEISGKHTY